MSVSGGENTQKEEEYYATQRGDEPATESNEMRKAKNQLKEGYYILTGDLFKPVSEEPQSSDRIVLMRSNYFSQDYFGQDMYGIYVTVSVVGYLRKRWFADTRKLSKACTFYLPSQLYYDKVYVVKLVTSKGMYLGMENPYTNGSDTECFGQVKSIENSLKRRGGLGGGSLRRSPIKRRQVKYF